MEVGTGAWKGISILGNKGQGDKALQAISAGPALSWEVWTKWPVEVLTNLNSLF